MKLALLRIVRTAALTVAVLIFLLAVAATAAVSHGFEIGGWTLFMLPLPFSSILFFLALGMAGAADTAAFEVRMDILRRELSK